MDTHNSSRVTSALPTVTPSPQIRLPVPSLIPQDTAQALIHAGLLTVAKSLIVELVLRRQMGFYRNEKRYFPISILYNLQSVFLIDLTIERSGVARVFTARGGRMFCRPLFFFDAPPNEVYILPPLHLCRGIVALRHPLLFFNLPLLECGLDFSAPLIQKITAPLHLSSGIMFFFLQLKDHTEILPPHRICRPGADLPSHTLRYCSDFSFTDSKDLSILI